MRKILNYIGGNLVPATSAKTIEVFNPAKGEVYAQAPRSDKDDVLLSIEAAKEAFVAWANTSIEDRSRLLTKMADLIDQRFEELALAECIDNGKPLALARKVDIPRAAANLRFFANAILQFSNDSYDMGNEGLNYTLRQPLGVVSCISPWNLPIYLFTWKIAPALAAGNCVIAKPSEVTPMTAYLLSELAIEAGMPPGVLNIIHGYGSEVGETMTSHPDIKAISFTGSTATGKIIATQAAPLFKKISLEMGGKNPNIIFEDCDYDKALNTTVHSSFANQGQICLCGSRIYIQKSLYNKFKNDLVAKAEALTVGNPLTKETKIGAVVSDQHMQKILHYIDLAEQEGGTILCGGKRKIVEGEFANGYFVEPTIIEGLPNGCQVIQEEIFGPVVTLIPFDTIDQAIALANDTSYGLSATVWSQNIDTINTMSRSLDAGIVWINTWLKRDLRTPFGGMKNSGVGREGGYDALRFFTEVKNVCIGH